MAATRPPILSSLERHLKPALGWRRIPFLIRVLWSLPSYRRRFFRPANDEGLRTFKQQFLLAGALYHELVRALGQEKAFTLSFRILYDIATAVQRGWYMPAGGQRTWEWFHATHHYQMRHGLIRFNEHDRVITTPDSERFHITRCRFAEAFADMGAPALTEAFCLSDETVFNEITPTMRFHRGSNPRNTIARGGSSCLFAFERTAGEPS